MRAKYQKNENGRNGFTLIELSIVTVISGLLFMALFELYAQYARQKAFDNTQDNIQATAAELGKFLIKRRRYPCPSDRTLPYNHPNYAKEFDPNADLVNKCNAAAVGLTPGNCYSTLSGITPAGTNGVGGVCMFLNAAGDAVLIGGVPMTTIRKDVGANSTSKNANYDGWNNQLDYVVTYKLTDKFQYRYDRGGITVHDEHGFDTAGIVNNAHFGLISHGPDKIGGYTRNGQMFAICGSHVPQSYGTAVAPGDDQNCSNNAVFIAGIRNDSHTAQHYDDVVYFVNSTSAGLWTQLPGSSDMYNINPGMVNVGTSANAPTASVTLNVGAPGGSIANALHVENNAKAKSVCKRDGTDCFDISAITHAADGTEPIKCAAGSVMIGVYTDGTGTHADCTPGNPPFAAPIPNKTCPPAQWLVGIDSDGNIICK